MTRLSAEHFDRLPLTCGNEKLTRLPFSPALHRPPPIDRDSRQQLKDNRQPIHVIHLTELRPHKIHLTAALEPFQQPNQICPEASLSQSGLGWATFYGHGRQLRSRLGWGGAGRGPRLVANGEMIAFYDLIKLDTNRSVDIYLSLSLMLSLSLIHTARDSVLLSFSFWL